MTRSALRVLPGLIPRGALNDPERFYTEDAVFEDGKLGHVWLGCNAIVDTLRACFTAMPARLEIDRFRAGGNSGAGS